ncbi:MAG: SIR2 family NAD-dependent protein deacylase [Gaiellaceae bacterium]
MARTESVSTGSGGDRGVWTDELSWHTRSVARKLLKGMVVPLLGAGVSACGRPSDLGWHLGEQRYLPSGTELAAYLAEEFDTPYEVAETHDLLRVSQFIDAVERSGGELYETLHRVFDADYPPGPVHLFFAWLAPLLRERKKQLQVILTTNYDDSLERAFEAAGEPYDLITYIVSSPKEYRGRFMHWPPDEQPRVIESANDYSGLDLSERTVILKLHGAVRRLGSFNEDNYVITEDHYIDYLTHTDIASLLPYAVTSALRNSHFLFLGYSMRDWNLRVILRRIWGEQALDYGSWSVQKDADAMEQAVWEKRNVEILTLDLEEYIAHLTAAVEERIELKAVP